MKTFFAMGTLTYIRLSGAFTSLLNVSSKEEVDGIKGRKRLRNIIIEEVDYYLFDLYLFDLFFASLRRPLSFVERDKKGSV